MPEWRRLQAGPAPAILAFELANRAYFAAFVSDWGDESFDFNLVFAGDGTAELGYRVAQHVAGRGVATATVAR